MSATHPTWITAFVDLAAPDFEPGVVFWAEVTGSRVSSPRGEQAEFATLVPSTGDAHLRVQRLLDGDTRLHLDLHVADPRVAADEAVGLGATEVADRGYVVLTSPAGLPFCFVSHPADPPPAQPARRRPTATGAVGRRSAVDQVCLDLGAASYEREWEFWSALTGFDPVGSDRPEFRVLEGHGPLRLLVQRLDDEPDGGPDGVRRAGYHLDLSSDDRAAEVARHVALGARVQAEHGEWTVLVDPAGSAYCVTDRVPGT